MPTWEVCSCFLFESINFSTLIKLSWIAPLLSPQTEQGIMRLSTPFLANAAFCLLILWYYLFPLLEFLPSVTQSVNFPFPYLKLLHPITSVSHVCFPPPTVSPETSWSSVQILPSPFSDLSFLNIVLDRLFPSSMKWVLLGERHSSFTEYAQVAWDCLITKKLPISGR